MEWLVGGLLGLLGLAAWAAATRKPVDNRVPPRPNRDPNETEQERLLKNYIWRTAWRGSPAWKEYAAVLVEQGVSVEEQAMYAYLYRRYKGW